MGTIEWAVFIPYLSLYFSGQFLWWPLWTIEPAAWVLYLVFFVPSTLLNVRGHFEVGSKT